MGSRTSFQNCISKYCTLYTFSKDQLITDIFEVQNLVTTIKFVRSPIKPKEMMANFPDIKLLKTDSAGLKILIKQRIVDLCCGFLANKFCQKSMTRRNPFRLVAVIFKNYLDL